MPRLHTFHFDIVTEYVSMNEQQPKPTPDDIRRTFTERGYHVDCYIDYEFYNLGRCHVYSIPFDNERLCHITHGFPGGMFINVRVLQRKLYPYFPPYRTEIKNIQKLSELNVDQIGKIYFKDLGPQIGWSIVFIAEYAVPLFIYIIILYFRPSLICGSTSASKSMHIAAHYNQIYLYLAIFILNEIGNLSSHLLLRDLRSPGTNERRISYSNKKKPFTNFVLFDFILQIIQSHSSLSSSPLLILTSDQYRQVLDDYLSTLNITYKIIIYRQQT
ncbi:unnamed protein product [Rotaria sp. Silwood1]|nr:unnamed protein product [Rotaria sp. Silwood1]CAF4874136.1 unnamed protein product [Rotaria sp. Silwood1]